MGIKKILRIAAFCLLVLLLLVMPLIVGWKAEVSAAEKTLKIGVGNPLTGPRSSVGIAKKQGFELAFDKVNGQGGLKIAGDNYKVQLLLEDCKGNPDGGATAANKLVYDQGVKFLVTCFFDGCIPPYYKVTSEAGGVLLIYQYGELSAALGGRQWDVGPDKSLFIRLHPMDDEIMLIPPEYLAKTYPNVKTVALVNLDIPEWDVLEPYSASQFPKYGLKLAGRMEKFAVDVVDFHPMVTRMLQYKPDSVYVLHGPLKHFVLIIKTFRDLGFKGPIFYSSPYDIGLACQAIPNLSDVFGLGVAMDAPNLPDPIREVVKLGRARYGKDFVADALPAYDVAILLFQLLEKANSTDPKIVQDTFEKLTKSGSLQSIYGPAHVGGLKTNGVNRVLVKPVPMCRVMNGKAEYVNTYTYQIP